MPDGTESKPDEVAPPPSPPDAPAVPSPSALSPEQASSSLKYSVKDGCAHAVMLGTGEASLSPFAIFLKADDMLLGLLTTLPNWLGSLIQIAAVRLLGSSRRRKLFVTVPVFIQALVWVPLAALPLAALHFGYAREAPLLLLACALVYFSLGGFVVPAWNSWMGDVVPPDGRGVYFARRDRFRLIFQLAAMLAAGRLLDQTRSWGAVGWGFAAVFGVALVARLFSVRYLRKMDEPPPQPLAEEERFTFLQFLRRTPKSNFGRFAIFQALFLSTTGLAGPFFAPFMLRDLGLSYMEYTAIGATFVLFQVLTLPAWGRIGDRYGNRRILVVTSLLISFLPTFWSLSTWYPYLVAFQVLGGSMWAGFSLASFNFFFDAVTPAKRVRCVAYYNTLVAFAVLLGGVAGGWLAPRLPCSIEFFGLAVLPLVSPLQVLFILSGLLRLLVTVFFLRAIREAREVEKGGWREILQSFFGEAPPREREP